MRFVLYLLFSFAFLGLPFAQSSDWKQIETPYLANLTILYQTKKGVLVAQNFNSGKFYLSFDSGKSWKWLNSILKESVRGFSENAIGEIFYIQKNKVFKINITTLNSELRAESSGKLNYNSIQVLENGDIITSSIVHLDIFDSQGNIKKIIKRIASFPPYFVKKQQDTNNILFITGVLYNVNKNYDFTGDSVRLDATLAGWHQFRENKGRLFLGRNFSDDYGKTWIPIERLKHVNNEDIILRIDYKNNLWFPYKDSIFYSEDNGETFKSKSCPLNSVWYFHKNSNDIIISKSFSCDFKRNITMISKDEGLSWQDISSNVNCSYAFKLSVGRNEHLIVTDCIGSYSKLDANSKWQSFSLPNPDNPILFTVKNTIYTKSDNTTHLYSVDKGVSWNKDYSLSKGNNNLDVVEGRDSFLYLHNDDQITYSYNAGNKWQVQKYANLQQSYLKKAVTKKLTYYFIKPIDVFREQLFRIRPNSSSLEPIKINAKDTISLIDLDSKFDSTIYVLGYDLHSSLYEDLELFYLDETKDTLITAFLLKGLFVDRFNAKLKIDHLGNIYVYDGYKLFLIKHGSQNWEDITPIVSDFRSINDLQVSYDNYIYLATNGAGILKYNIQLAPYLSDNEELLIETQIAKFSPNPTDGTVFIKLAKPMNEVEGILEIFDTKGTKINQYLLQANQNEYIISLENISNGLYFYTLTFGQQYRQQGKLIKF